MNVAWTRSDRRSHYNVFALSLFFVILLLFGGASRADVFGQPVVRLAAVLLAFSSAVQLDREGWRRVRLLVLFLIAIAVVIGIQVIPLPPDVWRSLPGRELYAQALDAAGIRDVWRPLSLTPDLTLNSLLSVLPPLAVILTLGLIDQRLLPLLVSIILIGIGVSAFLGLMQVATGGPYFYAITNEGQAVGAFANRNHEGMFIATAFPLLMGWAALGPSQPKPSTSRLKSNEVRNWVAICLMGALFPLLLVTGSRAGLLLGVVGAFTALALWLGRARSRRVGSSQIPLWRRALLLLPIVAGLLIFGLFRMFGRDEALRRLLQGEDSGMRSDLLPVFSQMIQDFFPVGTGFGAFDPVFRTYEPHEMLDPTYLNHAHNDLAQIVIEGGAPALLLFLVFLSWFALRAVRLWWPRLHSSTQLLGRIGFAVAAIILVASLIDYPLRTPIFAVLMAIACYWMVGSRSPTGAVGGS